MRIMVRDSFRGSVAVTAINLDDDSPFIAKLWKEYPDPFRVVADDHIYEYSMNPSREQLLAHTAQLELFPNGEPEVVLWKGSEISIE